MFSQLFETLFLWYSSGTKYGYKPQRGEFHSYLYLLGDFVLFIILTTHKEIMTVASPKLLAIVVVTMSLLMSVTSILFLSRTGIIKNLLLVEFLSLLVFLGFLCAMLLLVVNYRLDIIV